MRTDRLNGKRLTAGVFKKPTFFIVVCSTFSVVEWYSATGNTVVLAFSFCFQRTALI